MSQANQLIDFKGLLQRALTEPELRDAVSRLSPIAREAVAEIYYSKTDEMTASAAAGLKTVGELRERLEETKRQWDEERPRRPLVRSGTLLVLVGVLGAVGLNLAPEQYEYAARALCGAAFMVFLLIIERRHRAAVSKHEKSSTAAIATINAAVASAEQEREDEAYQLGVLPTLRATLNDARLGVAWRRASYSAIFEIADAPGLSEVFNAEHAIPTQAFEELDRFLQHSAGGSIGIAGPRGAGKSTLLRTVCGLERPIAGRKVVAVLTAAPVEYQPRDFILHLFAQVCQKAIELHGFSELERGHHPSEIGFLAPDRMRVLGGRSMRRAALVASITGAALVAVGIALTFALAEHARISVSEERGAGSEVHAEGVHKQDDTGASYFAPDTALPALRPAQDPPDDRPYGVQPLDLLVASGLKPAGFLLWGSMLFVAGYSVSFLTAGSRDRGNQRYVPPLVTRAQEHLTRIRFQQSYSSGWSGSLDLPAAIKGGLTSAQTAAQNQLTLPEIVSLYHSFVAELVNTKLPGPGGSLQQVVLVVGIDEVDRLGSDEKAYHFLNEIKAVFGIRRCYYLLTVSEDAISHFERRGLPIRDEFDSSFDMMIRCQYLTFEEAAALLNRRIIGLPLPFVAVCYSISGGLPRDLIRTARQMQHCVRDGAVNVFAVLHRIIAGEVRAKADATALATQRAASCEERHWLIRLARAIERRSGDSESYASFALELWRGGAAIPHEASGTEQGAGRAKVSRLALQLSAFLYFCDTVGAVFSRLSSEAHWRVFVSDETEPLGYARVSLAQHPEFALEAINEVRARHDLPAVGCGSAPTAPTSTA